jgi:hypothetical protein
MSLTDRTLLHLHIEAVWGIQLPPITPDAVDVTLLPESKLPRWKVCVADLVSGRVHLWRPNVAETEYEDLRQRADKALALPPRAMTTPDISREVAHSLTAAPVLDLETARSIARPLTIEDEALIAADFTEDPPDYFLSRECSPLIGVVVAGRLLCVAHSSRRIPAACELGIHTLGIARRKGYALASTILWTQGILQEGLVPLYSAMIENTPSLNLAAAAGYRPFTKTVNIR